VIPQLAQPVFLTDFLLGCFDIGGAISILALSGVFTLMTKEFIYYLLMIKCKFEKSTPGWFPMVVLKGFYTREREKGIRISRLA
jgi:U3 small nucleolar RNA-associated protein 19